MTAEFSLLMMEVKIKPGITYVSWRFQKNIFLESVKAGTEGIKMLYGQD